MTAKVPSTDAGSTSAVTSVARRLRRNTRITPITRTIDNTNVKFTSWMESRINSDRSTSTSRLAPAGNSLRISGNNSFSLLTTSTVFEPGCRYTARISARSPLNQLRIFSNSTLSTALPISDRRTGMPSLYAMINGLKSSAFCSLPCDLTV